MLLFCNVGIFDLVVEDQKTITSLCTVKEWVSELERNSDTSGGYAEC